MRRILLPLLILFPIFVFAQNEKYVKKVFTLSFLEPGAGVELPFAKEATVKFRAAITATPGLNSFENDIKFFPRPFGSISVRYYYNFDKRMGQGKNTNLNSANYVAFLGMYAGETFRKNENLETYNITPNLINAGFVWGIQRNYKNRFSLDLNVGLGFVGEKSQMTYGVIGEFTLGFWLNTRSKSD